MDMRRTALIAAPALAALLALASNAPAALDTTTLASRYASFQKKMKDKWKLTGLLTPVTSVLDRALRYSVRVTTGHINPTTMPTFLDDFAGRQAQLDTQIGITAAQTVSTGHDVIVAVLDSGFNLNHPAIASRVLPYRYDAVAHDWDPQDRGNGVDDDGDGRLDGGVGHGTFVSGKVLDVAPEAWIVPVRIADDEGYGMEDELVSGIDFALSMGVDVINISYEAGAITIGVRDKLRAAAQAGIVVVVSAGNDASDEAKALATEGTTIAVGAVDDYDHVAPFSNAPSDGVGMTLFAPGVRLYGPHGGPANDTVCTWSGTSFSAPLATGAVALALQLHPTWTNTQIRDRLRAASTAQVIAWNGSVYAYAGRLSLPAVVQN
jgi:subtilisin family serine protease